MRYLWQHLGQILAQYDGSLPLHHYLKAYFRQHPKLGSRDRRGLSDAVYAWYRAGKALSAQDAPEEQLRLAAMHLCGLRPRAFESFFPASWDPGSALSDRIADLKSGSIEYHPERLFPSGIELSEGISHDDWQTSLLHQPRLFLRIRGSRTDTERRMKAATISFEWITDTCLALPNATKLEGLLPADSYVVQDASSQATASYLQAQPADSWWDCCSGAGGKSLMLKDATPEVRLLATDVRESILNNLKERFRLYNHHVPTTAVLDAGDPAASMQVLGDQQFDGIICDVPCTGSGTWARTPESCFFFRPDTIESYASRQKAILRNASQFLKPGGRIIYITCSVFRAENEDVIEAITSEGGLRIESAGLINGLPKGADALFAAGIYRD